MFELKQINNMNKIILADTGIRRLSLHAKELEFVHPQTNQLQLFCTDLPGEFGQVLDFYRTV